MGLLRKQGIQIISINEPVEDTPSGRLLEGIIEVIDEFYSANLAQDVVRGMRENASRGFYPGGSIPSGYRRVRVQDGRKERSKLEPDRVSSTPVRRIFQECLAGKGLREIAKTLNSEGLPGPRGNPWNPVNVHRVLTNEAYTGTLVFDRERPGRRNQQGIAPVRVLNAWEPLVNSEMFSLARSLLHQRAPRVTHPRTATSPYLLLPHCSGALGAGTG